MKYRLLLLLFLILATIIGYSQGNVILQPAEIHPPKPGEQQKPKTETDEQLAAQFFQKKEYDKALILYEKLFKKDKNNINYTYYLYCLIELGEFKTAEKMVKSQSKDFPDRLKYNVDLGYVYIESGEISKGNKQFEETIKLIRADRNQVSEVANAFLMRGQVDYAVAAYRRGGELIRDYPFYLELGDLYNQVGNDAMMIDEYLNYLDFNPQNSSLIQAKLQGSIAGDTEGKLSEMLRKSLLKRIQKYPDKVFYSEMLLWLSIQEKDFEMALSQAKSIDRRYGEEGERILELAGLSLSNQNYDVAIEAYNYVLKKGKNTPVYVDAKIGLLTARYLKVTESFNYSQADLLNLQSDYLSTLDEYGINNYTIEVIRYLAHLQAFFLDDQDAAIDWLNKAIEIPNANPADVAECKIELADIMVFTGEVWEAKLLYAQVEKAFKNDPVGHMAKFKNAKLSFYIGEFSWAKAQADILKAATSKFISNDAIALSLLISENFDPDSNTVALGIYARADLLDYRNEDVRALQALDSIPRIFAYHPILQQVLYKKGEILRKQGNYAGSDSLFQQLVSEYPDGILADEALMQAALLNEKQLNNREKAMSLYQELLDKYPGSIFVPDARKKFRMLRGDTAH